MDDRGGTYLSVESGVEGLMPGLQGRSDHGVPEGTPSDTVFIGGLTSLGGGPDAINVVQCLIFMDSRYSDVPGQGLQGGCQRVGPTSEYTLYTATLGIQ